MKNSDEIVEKTPQLRDQVKSRAGDVAVIIIAGAVLLAIGRAGGVALMRLVSEGNSIELIRPRPRETEIYVGEEAGNISLDIPSPPASKLLFAGRTGGSPPGTSYRFVSEVAIDSVVEYYRNEMPSRGWRELEDHSRNYSEHYEGAALVFTRERGRLTMIWISPGEVEGPTMITILAR